MHDSNVRSWLLLTGALVLARTVGADIVDPTPHDYDAPPPAGAEAGTYAFTASGTVGPDCTYTAIGTARFLPHADGSGGQVCAKTNVELRGAGPVCALAPLLESEMAVLFGTYTYNGDGTLCEVVQFVGGPFAGREGTFLTMVGPEGAWILLSNQDLTPTCLATPPNGLVIGSVTGFRTGDVNDDPPGSGTLACTNP